MLSPVPWLAFVLAGLSAAGAAAAPGSLAGPAAAPSGEAAGGERQLLVAAAANLKPAMEDLVRAFGTERTGVRVGVTYGASGVFFAQIAGGAPFDVFFSADRDYPARLVEAGLARREDQAVYALGRLAVWLRPGVRADLAGRGLGALAGPEVRRLAIANPAVAPYGRAAEAALRSAGILEAVRPRLVLGQSVGQAAQFASTGAADAALIPLSLAGQPALASGTAFPVPAASHPPLEQAAVVLAAARSPSLARALLAFVLSPAGRAVLGRHGYELP